ncbi:hypothetical protein INS49_006177 [Diaporthe citri]|uniref:uncharacterized protein n=1 Tax=Diaporthe citri TaxID=83186 RepID=UPI001C7F779C|nr:uncharacterized protein INS49_006177 [Diaporthe citri]KAG6364575.1 hypothetical protein INS49_006177 [Diaporthe citri]
MYPPPSAIGKATAIPLAIVSQLFTQTFWAYGTATKYGHQALKISNHMYLHRLKTIFSTSRRRRPEYDEVFAILGNVFNAMETGRSALQRHADLRWAVVADYLTNLTDRFVESRMMLRGLRQQRRTWTATDREIQGRVADMQNISGEAMAHLDDYRNTGAAREFDAYLGQVESLFNTASEVQSRLGRECRSLQHLVVEFVKQDDEARAELSNEHMGHLAVRIRDIFCQSLEQASAIISHHDEQIRQAESS